MHHQHQQANGSADVPVPAALDEPDALPPGAASFADQVCAIATQLTALDREIHSLKTETAPLSPLLDELTRLNHPVLWLAMGREGIDRPGTIGALVGQQVVTVYARNRIAEWRRLAVGVALGVLLGALGLWVLVQFGWAGGGLF